MDGLATQCGMMGQASQAQPFGLASREFDGVDDYIETPAIDMTGLSTITLCAWVKINAYGRLVFSWLHTAAAPGESLEIAVTNPSLVIADDGGTRNSVDVGVVGLGVWSHLALVQDATTLYGYVNGSLVGSMTSSFNFSSSTDNRLFMGARLPGTGHSNCAASDCRVYDRGLSAGELADIVAGTDVPSGLLGRWIGNDDIVGSVVPDLSGNGRDGTNNGSAYSTDGPLDP